MISVIIPYYNHASAIKKALASIAAQTGVVTEVLLVDDGSTDTPPIEELQSIISNIRLIRQKNSGAPAARNRGLVESKGSSVIFWDADVVAKPTMLKQMKQILDTHADVDFVYSSFVFGPKTFTGQEWSYAALKERNFIHSTSLVRKSAAVQWDESLTKLQDWDYWLTMAAQRSKGYWIDEVLFTVGQRKEGMSRWIPSFAYQKPFRYLPGVRDAVRRYEEAEEVVREKHNI